MEITLTEKGEVNYERILELVYMFINKIKQGVDGQLPRFIFDENKKMNEYNFDSITKTTAINYANSLCSRASTIINEDEISDLLWRPYELKFFD